MGQKILGFSLILFIVFRISISINKIHRKRLEENIQKTHFQKIISDISLEFLSINSGNIDKTINIILEKIGSFFLVDRAYILMTDNQDRTVDYQYEWCKKGIGGEKDRLVGISLVEFPWWMKELKENGLINIRDMEALPSEAFKEIEELFKKRVKSLIMVPIEVGEDTIGFIGCDSINFYKEWSDYQIGLLKSISNILGKGLIKIRSEKEIECMAYYDHLTGLPNRTLFGDRVNQAIEVAKRNGHFIAIMFMDLDSFKRINDTIGHSGGDKILVDVANDLSKILRKTDTVARFGGDEFLIMINNIQGLADIIGIADKVMDMFKKSFSVDGYEFYITASGGISLYPIDGEDVETLIKNADIAMYKSKEGGKNRYTLCSLEIKEEVKRNMGLLNHLSRMEGYYRKTI